MKVIGKNGTKRNYLKNVELIYQHLGYLTFKFTHVFKALLSELNSFIAHMILIIGQRTATPLMVTTAFGPMGSGS